MTSSSYTLHIEGYASLFNVSDLSGDIVHMGAFAASLLGHMGSKIPMLFSHETQLPIGVWDRVVEDQSGLWVVGRLLSGSERADYVGRLVCAGALSGLSIGYRPRRYAPRTVADPGRGGRLLSEIELQEISVVTFPMLPQARIQHVSTESFSLVS